MSSFRSRRSFLASASATAGALTLGFRIPFPSSFAATASPEVTAWVVIEPDDTVIIRVAKSEMGQGVLTALPMLVAEELECDWSKVKPQLAAPHENQRRRRIFGDMSTAGSRSVRSSHEPLRRAGAMARQMLISAAANTWNVPADECRAERSVVTHTPSGRSVRYGEIAEAAAHIEPPTQVVLKSPREWKLLGKPIRRLDVPDKVTGRTVYGIDVRVPGMLYAAVAQSPVFGGKLQSVDASSLTGFKGVRKLVQLDDAVAVVAESWWVAKQALEGLDIAWDDRNNGSVSSETIAQLLHEGLSAKDAGIGRSTGNVEQALADAVRRVDADYSVPFLAHATLEPQNCTAHVTPDRVEVWVPTQNGEAALAAAAQAAGVPPRNVMVHTCMLGGGFGRRGFTHDFVTLAVRIARQVEHPVQVLWSREEDMRHDFYRPAVMSRMTAGLNAEGLPIAWHVRLAGPSILGISLPNAVDKHVQEGFLDDMPYTIPHYRADHAKRATHVPVGFWRCVNHTQNCFFRESFLDELAHTAGEDPYHYRRRLLQGHPHARELLSVLDAAAERADWGTSVAGVHRGLALNEVNGTFTAAVVELSGTDALRIRRVISAIDCGALVNPLIVERQIISATTDGLGAALYGHIAIAEGRVQQSNFHDYRMLRLAEMPEVLPVIVRSERSCTGAGEPPVAVVAPALCNAIYAATGRRIRALPLQDSDLRLSRETRRD
ncbi:MAG: molybdopterin cofactor-binding domain-containing protein [Xanthobacteraceae bacterium]